MEGLRLQNDFSRDTNELEIWFSKPSFIFGRSVFRYSRELHKELTSCSKSGLYFELLDVVTNAIEHFSVKIWITRKRTLKPNKTLNFLYNSETVCEESQIQSCLHKIHLYMGASQTKRLFLQKEIKNMCTLHSKTRVSDHLSNERWFSPPLVVIPYRVMLNICLYEMCIIVTIVNDYLHLVAWVGATDKFTVHTHMNAHV